MPWEFAERRDAIARVHQRFTLLVNGMLQQKNGRIDQADLNACVLQAIRDCQVTGPDEVVIEGFYDFYAGTWHCAGREVANQMVQALLG